MDPRLAVVAPLTKRRARVEIEVETDLTDEELARVMVIEFSTHVTHGRPAIGRMYRDGWPHQLGTQMFRGNILGARALPST